MVGQLLTLFYQLHLTEAEQTGLSLICASSLGVAPGPRRLLS